MQGGNKSAITGILMTSFAAFGASLSIPAPRCGSSIQSLTLVLLIRRVCVFGAGYRATPSSPHPHRDSILFGYDTGVISGIKEMDVGPSPSAPLPNNS
jgi:hypothetical protein